MNARKVLLTIALAVAFLPVLNWYWLRLGNGSGEPFGLVALLLAIVFASQHRHPASPVSYTHLTLPTIYAV